MYHILSVINKDSMPNIEFKKELLKIQIEKMADDDYVLYSTIFTLNNRLIKIIENNLLDNQATSIFDYEQNVVEKYLDSKLYYLGSILPYIKYDY